MSSQQGAAQLPSNLLLNLRRRLLLAEGIGVYQAAIAGKVQTQWIGEQQVQNQKLVELEWNSEVGPIRLFVDPQTHLVTGAGYTATTSAGSIEMVELWSDFREVHGVKLPFHLASYQGRAQLTDVTVKDIKVNVSLDPSLFNTLQP
jgi:hypothetical protein